MSVLFLSESSQAICKPILVLKATCAFETSLPERSQTFLFGRFVAWGGEWKSFLPCCLQVPSLTAPALNKRALLQCQLFSGPSPHGDSPSEAPGASHHAAAGKAAARKGLCTVADGSVNHGPYGKQHTPSCHPGIKAVSLPRAEPAVPFSGQRPHVPGWPGLDTGAGASGRVANLGSSCYLTLCKSIRCTHTCC